MLINIIGVVTIILLLGLLFLRVGQHFLLILFENTKYLKPELLVSMSYFMGLSLFLFQSRVVAYFLSNAFWGVVGALLSMIMLTVIAVSIKKSNYRPFFRKLQSSQKIFLLSILLGMSIIKLIIFTNPVDSIINVNAFSSLGSLHSVRYVNIAAFIVDNNFIPIINQNYGQSLLSTPPLFLGFDAPFLALFLLLCQTTFFLIIGTYGLLMWLGTDRKNAIIGATIIWLGNTALSFSHILVIDSGSPFLVNGYSDSIISIGTFVLFHFWLDNFYWKMNKANLGLSVFFIVIMGITWNIYAPQNIFIISGILVIHILRCAIVKEKKKLQLSFFLAVFLLASGGGAMMGGMLTPGKYQGVNIKIDGLMQISKTERNLSIRPGIMYHYFSGKWTRPDLDLGKTLTIDQYVAQYSETKSFTKFLQIALTSWHIMESNLWTLFRIMFFPITGMFGLWVLFKMEIQKNLCDYKKRQINLFLNISTISFLIGVVPAFSLSLNGYKWELTRFMMIGVFYSMCAFSIFINKIIWRNSRQSVPSIGVLAMLLLILPPIFQMLVFIVLNISNPEKFFNAINIVLGST